jgi:hypothetical protein
METLTTESSLAQIKVYLWCILSTADSISLSGDSHYRRDTATHVYQLKVLLCNFDMILDEANGILKVPGESVILPAKQVERERDISSRE